MDILKYTIVINVKSSNPEKKAISSFETVCLLSRNCTKTRDYVQNGIDAEDYYYKWTYFLMKKITDCRIKTDLHFRFFKELCREIVN